MMKKRIFPKDYGRIVITIGDTLIIGRIKEIKFLYDAYKGIEQSCKIEDINKCKAKKVNIEVYGFTVEEL